jgi:hypothetical protein
LLGFFSHKQVHDTSVFLTLLRKTKS